MAELFSSYAVTEILKLVQSIVADTVTGAWGLKGDLLKLSESAGRLQSLLQKLHYVPAVEDDENIKRWLNKLQTVVYAAADLVDEFHYEILRRKVEIKSQLKRKLREFVSCNNPILFRVDMAFKVKEVWASLADMEKEAPLVLLTVTAPTMIFASNREVVLDSRPDRTTDSFLSKRPIGRTEEAEKIIQMVQVNDGAPRLSVVSIVGFGGIGKTTLAQLVFEEAKKKKLFDELMWVCVSEPFDIQKILGEMLEKLDKTTGGLRSIDVIVGELKHHLKNKRFLLVLDDVWNTDSEKWDSLRVRLDNICGKIGNFVIATTRSTDVAVIMKSKYMEKLKQLSNKECWNIIKDMVLGISREMKVIGMAIAKKCGGVPLAAKVIGGVLSSHNNKAEWLSILDSNVWNEVDEDKRILGVLKLSLDHLPPPQRLCFAYCSLFPKDAVFEKTQLIQLWMAEDFLNTSLTNEGKSAKLMEDVGDEYFHSLLVNSFFQNAQADGFGNIIRFKMHDILHDLASSISKSRILQCGSNCFETSGGQRLSFSCDQASKVEEILKESEDKTRNLRCLFCRVDVSPMLSTFQKLRSLDFSNAKLKDLPNAIGKLKHLRYLDISNNATIEEMPESITKLYNLQTLRVFRCRSLEELPSKVRNLMSLRHLGIDDKRLMPLGVGCLTNLQTLPFFVVGIEKGQKIDELEGLKELRGELVICGLENVKDKEESEKARMKEKKLSKLVLQWMEIEKTEAENLSSSAESKHEEVMRGLEVPTSIQSLTVEWYMGKQFPEWMSELYKLAKLTLNDCRRCERMPTLGHLPNLKVLTVESMDSMKFIGAEFYGESNNEDTLFPSLEELNIMQMESIVEWVSPKRSEVFPKLQRLYITDCPNLTSFPLSQSTSTATHIRLQNSSWEILCYLDFKSLEEFFIRDCPKLTFLHIGLTSLSKFNFHRYHSKKLRGSQKVMILEGPVKIIEVFPEFLEGLEIDEFDHELSVEAFHGLSCLNHLVFRSYQNPIPNLSSLTYLKHLELRRCYGLKSIPILSSFTSLEHLEIDNCDRIESIPSLSSLTSLKKLRIGECRGLCSLPNSFSTLACLEYLSIWSCPNLTSIPDEIKSCTSLKVLRVTFCSKIVSIDDDKIGSLTQLEKLNWGGFSKELDQVPGLNSIDLLTSLEYVTIYGWIKLTTLPHQLQHLNSITTLSIYYFDGMESLPDWLSNLKSLEMLSIQYCKNLNRLPADMNRLSKLTTLVISNCPLLAPKCCMFGSEWFNISRIPNVIMEQMRRR